MATLPDLETTEISWIGYWNFLDAGGSEIDPYETVSAMDAAESYENGVDGVISMGMYHKNRLVNVRVKKDGWIIAWLDDTFEIGTKLNEPPDGPYDVIDDWTDENTPPAPDHSNLHDAISKLHEELSNSAEATLESGDVALYPYHQPEADYVTWFSIDEKTEGDITPTSDTTLHECLIALVSEQDSYDYWNYGTNEVVKLSTDYGEFASRDVVARGELKAGETTTAKLRDFDSRLSGYVLWS